MAKVWTYITVMLGMTFLLKLAGIPTGLDWLFNYFGFGSGEAINNSTFYIRLGASLAVIGVATLVATAFGRTAPEYVIKAPFVVANILIFIATFVSITNYMSNFSSWLYWPIFMIMFVFGVGFLWAAYSSVFEGDN